MALDDLTLAPFAGAAGTITQVGPGNYELDVQFNFPFDATISLRDAAITDRYGEPNPAASVTTRQMWRAVTRGESLVAWWPFDGDVGTMVGDRSGLDNNATLFDAVFTMEGKFGQGVRFPIDKPDARIRDNSANGIDLVANSYSLSAWFKGLYPTYGHNTLFRSMDKSNNIEWDRMVVFRSNHYSLFF